MKKFVIVTLMLLLAGLLFSCGSPDDTAAYSDITVTVEATSAPVTEEPCAVTVDGIPLTSYTVVYAKGDGYAKLVASFLCREIEAALGVTVHSMPDENDVTDYEIRIGKTNRCTPKEKPEYYSYEIYTEGDSIILCGYDNYAIGAAADELVNMLCEGSAIASASLSKAYTLPDREEYIRNIDALYMRWIAEWQPNDVMLDFESKIEALTSPTDRLLTIAHRGECDFYPENSIESIISFYKMGGDAVELDIRATKDGVLVLMHDGTLKRMTNWSELRGKTVNGITLPTSNDLTDWTYEELMQLSLKEGDGGSDAKVTPFKIPTLTEALTVCKNRLFIIPDKSPCWRYANVKGVLDDRPDIFLFDCMKAADNYNSILLSFSLTPEKAASVQKYIFENSGVVPYLLIRDIHTPPQSIYNALSVMAFKDSFAIQIGGTFQADVLLPKYGDAYEKLRDKVTITGWTISNAVDNEYYWQQMYDLGYRMIMTNDYLSLVRFASQTYGE